MSRHIPEDVSREVLTRAGHKCSACGEPCPLERAHIVPFSETHDHRAENLVCLCANCHSRADDSTTGWDVPTMQRYRDDPWVNRSRRMGDRQSLPSHVPQNLPCLTLGTLFKGRDAFLADLRESLASRPTVIHGMGGVGKTRAAVEYALRRENDYVALLFVSADAPDSLRRNLAALCGPLVLDLPEQNATEIQTQETAVLKWLQRSGWLLVFDNVDSPDAKAAVLSLRPHLRSGHVLITSRIAFWPQDIGVRELHALEEPDAVAMLMEHSSPGRVPREDDPARAADIARQLGCLCLALEQAAAWLKKSRKTFSDYLSEWERIGVQLHADYHDRGLNDYHPGDEKENRSLLITFEVSLAQLSDDARRLLHILAWLAPDPMPCEHLEKIEGLPDPRGLLVELSDLHLASLSADGTTFVMHRLLQEITRQQQQRLLDCGSPLPLFRRGRRPEARSWWHGRLHGSDWRSSRPLRGIPKAAEGCRSPKPRRRPHGSAHRPLLGQCRHAH